MKRRDFIYKTGLALSLPLLTALPVTSTTLQSPTVVSGLYRIRNLADRFARSSPMYLNISPSNGGGYGINLTDDRGASGTKWELIPDQSKSFVRFKNRADRFANETKYLNFSRTGNKNSDGSIEIYLNLTDDRGASGTKWGILDYGGYVRFKSLTDDYVQSNSNQYLNIYGDGRFGTTPDTGASGTKWELEGI